MVTKCDLVDGFAEYSRTDGRRARAGVGSHIPYEQTLANEGPQVFPTEFDALVTRLNERVFGRVEEERNARRRTKVFAFPSRWRPADALTQWVSDVFASATSADGFCCAASTSPAAPRKARPSIACSEASAARSARRRRIEARGTREGVFCPESPERRDDRRVGPCRREPPLSCGTPRCSSAPTSPRADCRSRRGGAVGQLPP